MTTDQRNNDCPIKDPNPNCKDCPFSKQGLCDYPYIMWVNVLEVKKELEAKGELGGNPHR